MIAVMKKETEMYKEIIRKRLERKTEQLKEAERIMSQGDVTSSEKRKFMELKAVVQELENILDIAETMFKDE